MDVKFLRIISAIKLSFYSILEFSISIYIAQIKFINSMLHLIVYCNMVLYDGKQLRLDI